MRVKDIKIGETYNGLKIVEDLGRCGSSRYYKCLCSNCGAETRTASRNIGTKTCCEKCSNERRIVDMTGKKFGGLQVVENAGFMGKRYIHWRCICDCGNEVFVDNTCKLAYAGIISKEDAASEVDLQYPDSTETIRKEAEEELYRKTYIPLKAKYDAAREYGPEDVANDVIVTQKDNQTNPYKEQSDNGKPGVDNNASRKPDTN